MKFFREHNRLPEVGDEAYEYDTRFFSPKQTKKDVEPWQQVIDQLTLTGHQIPVTVQSRLKNKQSLNVAEVNGTAALRESL